jgi:hypothetical protein
VLPEEHGGRRSGRSTQRSRIRVSTVPPFTLSCRTVSAPLPLTMYSIVLRRVSDVAVPDHDAVQVVLVDHVRGAAPACCGPSRRR